MVDLRSLAGLFLPALSAPTSIEVGLTDASADALEMATCELGEGVSDGAAKKGGITHQLERLHGRRSVRRILFVAATPSQRCTERDVTS